MKAYACLVAAVTACGRVGFDATHDGGVDTGAVDGPTACVDPCALPLQPVVPLDSFDRPVGPLGAPWVTTSPDWLLTGSDLQVTGYSFAFYTAITGGAAQWAEVTLSQPTFNSELGVVLRGTGTNLASDRAIVVEYHEDPLSHFTSPRSSTTPRSPSSPSTPMPRRAIGCG